MGKKLLKKSFMLKKMLFFLLLLVNVVFFSSSQIVFADSGTGDTTWQESYAYMLEDNKIVLYWYVGNETDIFVPRTATIGGITYQTVLYGDTKRIPDENPATGLITDANQPSSNGIWHITGSTWMYGHDTIKSITFEDGVSLYNDKMRGLFYGLSNLESINGLNYIDVSMVTDMRYLFDSDENLKFLDISEWDISNVTAYDYIFRNVNTAWQIKTPKVNPHSDISVKNTYKFINNGIVEDSETISNLPVTSGESKTITTSSVCIFVKYPHIEEEQTKYACYGQTNFNSNNYTWVDATTMIPLTEITGITHVIAIPNDISVNFYESGNSKIVKTVKMTLDDTNGYKWVLNSDVNGSNSQKQWYDIYGNKFEKGYSIDYNSLVQYYQDSNVYSNFVKMFAVYTGSEVSCTPATCEENGLQKYKISEITDASGNEFTYEMVLLAKGHSLYEETMDSTCTADGYHRIICENCGEVIEENVLLATGHNWGDWTVVKEATESDEGLKERICSTCGEKESITIPKIEKILDEEIIEETINEQVTEQNIEQNVTSTDVTSTDATVTSNEIVKTGDNTNLLFLIIVIISGIGIMIYTIITFLNKKK